MVGKHSSLSCILKPLGILKASALGDGGQRGTVTTQVHGAPGIEPGGHLSQ